MSQHKQIVFLQGGNPVVRLIDLEQLSIPARMLATAISTTVCYDNNSKLYIQSNQTNEQYWQDIADHGDPYSLFSHDFAVYMSAEYQSGQHRRRRDEHPTQIYLWDGLRLNETPEQYFERHASFIQAHNWTIAKK